ncbi:MAG: vitamin B12 dependent-methionine synthase activation domain-containing protein, partial [Thermoanaerobaculia bacterium]
LGRRAARPLLPIATARQRRTPIDWAHHQPPVPAFTGVKVQQAIPLAEIVPFIDWSPFFHTWEIRGRYPSLLEDPVVGPKAQELFDDAQALLKEIVDGRLLTANAVSGFFPAASVGDDIEVYADSDRTRPLTTFHTLRQQMEKPAGQWNQALSDYVAPKASGVPDTLGLFAVTAGIGVPELCARFEKDHDDYRSILVKALADRLAEALAEKLHKEARVAWGFGAAETWTNEDLIKEKYRGIRPAPGYPACPDHTEKRLLFDLLSAEENAGITLTENFAMFPASSVSGFYFAHPEAKYFGVGKLDPDQVADYAARKGMGLAVIERWLSPNLNYEPVATVRGEEAEKTESREPVTASR